MFFTVRELVQWLGLTVFEIWVNLLAVTLFTTALAVKVETGWGSWWLVFAPLFAGDALNAYFCTIVFIRMHLEGMYKVALMRGVWSLSFLLLLFVFKFLLCKKLSGQSGLVYSEVMSPIFILLQLFFHFFLPLFIAELLLLPDYIGVVEGAPNCDVIVCCYVLLIRAVWG
uniref:Transmembrane protein 203 n=2 Tax=Timema TaxID=61471 RepID=A0A7R9IQ86_9NEOP|nr:unnamed protein product [Timema bartmani]CAD7462608.1 unnamed protein product [Timema tahoe]